MTVRTCPRCFRLHDDAKPCPVSASPTLFDDPAPRPIVDANAFSRGMAGSALAARKWSVVECAAVDRAILRAAREMAEFTADDVWERAPDVRVTKGLAGRLNAARNRGWIKATGRVRVANRGGAHDHRQRLAIWRSLVYAEVAG